MTTILISNASSLGMKNFSKMSVNATCDVSGSFVPCLSCSIVIEFVNIFFIKIEELFTSTISCAKFELISVEKRKEKQSRLTAGAVKVMQHPVHLIAPEKIVMQSVANVHVIKIVPCSATPCT